MSSVKKKLHLLYFYCSSPVSGNSKIQNSHPLLSHTFIILLHKSFLICCRMERHCFFQKITGLSISKRKMEALMRWNWHCFISTLNHAKTCEVLPWTIINGNSQKSFMWQRYLFFFYVLTRFQPSRAECLVSSCLLTAINIQNQNDLKYRSVI